ncbi:uncharacterized protein LOC103579971 isoform X2 [Microplitis demolitor]|uniref:uncharacterized protein LOC103579971 isoform X2 n=1 Tax=Microplitis demolitor TaxID=69319 RepID=UPI0004CCFF50|nr:uncharacterized protein LOC103579971 isoform X2 [Microplitis demolitor]
MKNVIIELIVTLVIFFSISFIDSHLIDKRSPATRGVIIGPDTPVYYLEYPHDEYLKVIRYVNKFEASPSYDYYRYPENKFNVTLFPAILVVVNWHAFEYKKLEDILNDVVTEWNKVDEYFEQLDNPKIKLTIAGVVIPTKLYIWERIMLADELSGTHYYRVPSLLNTMTKWFYDHDSQFESLKYDFFIFMSHWKVIEISDSYKRTEFYGYSVNEYICDNDNDPDYYSPGGIVVENTGFSINAAATIASILGVQTNRELKCGSDYILDASQSGNNYTWSECSKRAFRSMVNNNNYACLQQLIYNQEEDYV